MFEVKKVLYQGEVYTPVFHNSRMLSLEELEILASEPVEDAPERFAQCILITTEKPKLGQWETLPARFFDVPVDCQLCFGDTHLGVATITHVESIEDADIGPHLVAVVKFLPTRLAEICYRGMCTGVLGGVCCVVLWGERRGIDLGIVQEVRIGALEDSCLPSARIWPIREVQHDNEKRER